MKVVWTANAANHLRAIHAYLAQNSPSYALQTVDRLTRGSEYVGEFPMVGRVVPEIGRQQVRELILESYRLMYHVRPNKVEVLAVLHGARDFKVK